MVNTFVDPHPSLLFDYDKTTFQLVRRTTVSTIFLKIKLKTLAAEARIIRRQEKKTKGTRHNATRESLYLHRTGDMRKEARATHLAYGYLRGRKLSEIENKFYTEPDWERVERMVRKYGTLDEKYVEWRSETTVRVHPVTEALIQEALVAAS